MAVSLIHEYLAGAHEPARSRSSELRPIDLFDDLDDGELERWAPRPRAARARPRARCSSEQGERPPGLHLLLDGLARGATCSTARARRAGRPAPGADLDRARSPRSPAGRRRSACRRRHRRATVARSSSREPFIELVLAHRAGARPRSCARSRPVVAPDDRDASRTASGSRRSARWPPASRTSSTTRPRPRSAPPPSWPRRSTCSSSTLGRFVESGRRARAGRSELVAAPARGARARAESHGARRARRRRRRRRAARALEALGVEEPWRLAEPLAAAGVDAHVARARRRARGPGDRRRACAGSPRR